MLIKLNEQTLKINEEDVKKATNSKEILTLLKSQSGDSSIEGIVSIKHLDIESIRFENFTEFSHVKSCANGIFDSSTEVIIGKKGSEVNTWEFEVDKIQNVLLNISEYQLLDLEPVGIKTYVFNAKLNTLANFFNVNASESINLNVRDDVALMNFKRDSMEFLETMKNNKSNFYLYNGGVTIITASDINIINDETIKISQPKVINGAQTIARYIYYKLTELRQELSYEDNIEIPLRLMVVSEGSKTFFEDIAMDISLKINSHNAVTTDNLNYLLVKKLGLINQDDGLDIKPNKNSMREYQKLYTNVIMGRPGTAKSGMANLIQNCVDDKNLFESESVWLKEKNEKSIIFTHAEVKLILDESVNFLWFFEEYNGNEILEIKLHHIVDKYIYPEYKTVMDKIEMANISSKYNQYITGIYFALISAYVTKLNQMLELPNIQNLAFNKACNLVINVTPILVEKILVEFENASSNQLGESLSQNLQNNDIFGEMKKENPFIVSIWNRYEDSKNDDKKSFAKDYVYSAHTFKTDELYNFYIDKINLIFDNFILLPKDENMLVDALLDELGI